MSENLNGPTFEEAEEGMAIPECKDCYVSVESGKPHKAKNPKMDAQGVPLTDPTTGQPIHSRMLFLTLKISGHNVPKYDGRTERVYWGLDGKFSFTVRNAMSQAGLDDIQKLFDRKHVEYVGDENRPVFNTPDDEMWERILNFYLTGDLTDDNDVVYDCTSGGLIGKTLHIRIAKPGKDKTTNIEQTGIITVLKT